jgi:hypothetical protein
LWSLQVSHDESMYLPYSIGRTTTFDLHPFLQPDQLSLGLPDRRRLSIAKASGLSAVTCAAHQVHRNVPYLADRPPMLCQPCAVPAPPVFIPPPIVQFSPPLDLRVPLFPNLSLEPVNGKRAKQTPAQKHTLDDFPFAALAYRRGS